MLTPERQLASAIYILYAADCVHWLKSGQIAVTRQLSGTWRLHEYTPTSYTLLGWMPVIVNPLDLRPSFAWIRRSELTNVSEAAEELLTRELPDIDFLTLLSIIGTINMLVLFPAVLVSGFVLVPWLVPATIALAVQIAVGIEIFLQSAKWRSADHAGFWRQYLPLLLNPIAALRSGDVMLKVASEREVGEIVPRRS